MPTNTTRRCHWVPQGYLRSFAADPPARSKIWRLSKIGHAGRAELRSISKVAVRHHLYVPRDPQTGRRDDAFERRLSGLERWFGEPAWRAVSSDMVDLSWRPIREMVALLAAVMQFRNPRHFEFHRRMHRSFVELFEGPEGLPASVEIGGVVHDLDPGSWPAYRDAEEDDLKRSWIDEIGRAGWYAERLIKMRWSVVCNDAATFVTSDNPISIIHPSLQFRGVSDCETTILFPLSPTRLLCMDNRHQEPANQYYPVLDDGSSANLLIWRSSNEFMFSHRHPDEVCANLIADCGLGNDCP